ncbi:hypothetical protein [Candidatus Electronema sp. TJ]|uniref:hypothetical protein n=1 Tax=Candidatus Electronema sp. TJ TaxID=3401573 RepID=UPI003AA88BB5
MVVGDCVEKCEQEKGLPVAMYQKTPENAPACCKKNIQPQLPPQTSRLNAWYALLNGSLPGFKTSGGWLSDLSLMLIIFQLFCCLLVQLFRFVLF